MPGVSAAAVATAAKNTRSGDSMDNWFGAEGGGSEQLPTPYYGKGPYVEPENQAPMMSDPRLYGIMRYNQGVQTGQPISPEGPVARNRNLPFYMRQQMMNNWFSTPGMIDAGAYYYPLGHKESI